MRNDETGSEIVANMAGDRPWWRLRAQDMQPWLATLPPSALPNAISGVAHVGKTWDGKSDIPVGSRTMSGRDAGRLVARLRRGIRSLNLPRVALPDHTSVRQCLSKHGTEVVAVEVDFGDFIVPLSLAQNDLANGGPDLPAIVAGMLRLIAEVEKRRAFMAARELRLRRVAEETAARIGHGAAPVWLRCEPFQHAERPGNLSSARYLLVMALLNEQLVWAPMGDEEITTVKQIRDHRGYHSARQRTRAAALARLRETGSAGWISDVALALIEERGLNPGEVFRQAVEARARDRSAGVHFDRKGRKEMLYHDDGVLAALFAFEGGAYKHGELSLWGDHPETLVAAARGRRLFAFVGHPALEATHATVLRAEKREGGSISTTDRASFRSRRRRRRTQPGAREGSRSRSRPEPRQMSARPPLRQPRWVAGPGQRGHRRPSQSQGRRRRPSTAPRIDGRDALMEVVVTISRSGMPRRSAAGRGRAAPDRTRTAKSGSRPGLRVLRLRSDSQVEGPAARERPPRSAVEPQPLWLEMELGRSLPSRLGCTNRACAEHGVQRSQPDDILQAPTARRDHRGVGQGARCHDRALGGVALPVVEPPGVQLEQHVPVLPLEPRHHRTGRLPENARKIIDLAHVPHVSADAVGDRLLKARRRDPARVQHALEDRRHEEHPNPLCSNRGGKRRRRLPHAF